MLGFLLLEFLLQNVDLSLQVVSILFLLVFWSLYVLILKLDVLQWLQLQLIRLLSLLELILEFNNLSLQWCLQGHLGKIPLLLAFQISTQSLYHAFILPILFLNTILLINEHLLPIVVHSSGHSPSWCQITQTFRREYSFLERLTYWDRIVKVLPRCSGFTCLWEASRRWMEVAATLDRRISRIE